MKIWGEITVAAALIVLHTGIITLPQRKVGLSTSNIITNCIRIQSLRVVAGDYHVMGGSSMTGRLDAAAASNAAGLSVVNLGLDGCGPVEVLEFLLRTPAPPRTVLLELNALTSVNPANARAVMEATSGMGDRIRSMVPLLRYEERPVDIVYSWMHMLKSQTGGSGSLVIPPLRNPRRGVSLPLDYRPDAVTATQEVVGKAEALRSRGTEIILVMLPDNGAIRANEHAAAEYIGSKLDIPLLDIKSAMEKQLSYTDSVHLTADSATRLSRVLGTWLRERAGNSN